MRKLRHSTKSLFFGIPASLIARWCDVTVQTAAHWKTGVRKPGPLAIRLFKLHYEERVLTDEWQGFGVRRGRLYDPEGHEFTAGQLRAYSIVYALAMEYGRTNPRAQETLVRLASLTEPRGPGRPRKGDRDAARSAAPAPTSRTGT